MSAIQQIPVILLTGFLGSGKTTLLARLLALPAWADTAVLVNELGAIGLDHHLLWGASGNPVLLENGCICCTVRDDLPAMLEAMFWHRLHRKMPRFARVVIETTGLADPRPIVAMLSANALVAERYRLQALLCTVDAQQASAQAKTHPEFVVQVACADLIVLTKTDLVSAHQVQALERELRLTNAWAGLRTGNTAALTPADLRAAGDLPSRATAQSLPWLPALGAAANPLAPTTSAKRPFHARVSTCVIRFTKPWQVQDLTQALHQLVQRHGPQILRIKGLVQVAEQAEPMLVQVVGQQVFAMERMVPKTEAPASFVVCISLGLTEAQVGAVLGQA